MHSQKATLTSKTLFQESQATGLNYVLKLNPDKLLSPAYTALGKHPKASTYGGWESQQIQGHMLGHYLSALSGFVYQTGDKDAKEKLDYTIKCIKEIQRSDGYVGGIPSKPFDTVFESNGNFQVDRFSLASWWVPWYSVHKIYAGLIDAYVWTGNKDALDIVKKMADWAIKGTSKMTDEQLQKMFTCEHGGMCKVFADLYGITKDKKYLKEAERWIHHEIIDPTMKERDALQGYHANTQIPKFLGIARLYELTGKKEYRTSAEFFFNTVTQKRSYAIGGNSIGEHFGPEYSEKLGRDTCETCNSYNMLELAEHIFDWNRDSTTADFYETALYNHILASQDPKTGSKTYFVSMLPGFFKVYSSFENAMWCCTGTGLENPERYNRFIAREEDSDLYVNLFIPSTIQTEDGLLAEIQTSFPFTQQAVITVKKAGSKSRNLKVRIPSWVQEKEGNGYKDYGTIKDGMSVTVDLPMKLNVRKARDRSGNFSILYGPIVLAADLGTSSMPNDIVDNQLVYMNYPAKDVSLITADLSSPEKWIKASDAKTLTFKTEKSASQKGESFTLKPFFNIHHVRYATYFPSQNSADDTRAKKFEAITLDAIEPGRQQSEIEHHYKSQGTEAGYISSVDRSFRTVKENDGWFGYRVKFEKGKEYKIVVTVLGSDKGSISLSYDGKEIGSLTNDGSKGDTLLDLELPVSKDFVNDVCSGKKLVRKELRFTAKDSQGSLRLLEVRLTK